jgi:hypothetical protein
MSRYLRVTAAFFSSLAGNIDRYPKRAATILAVCLLASTVAPLTASAASAASVAPDSIIFSDGPGMSAPPSTLGPYTMTPFSADTQPLGEDVSGVAGPTGTLGFSPSLEHHTTPYGGWATWSNDYTGDVYATTSPTATLTLPPGTQAFYLYAEPEEFQVFTITATNSDGTTSGAIPVSGEWGAAYFGFYSTGSAPLTSITVTAAGPDGFAVGEFGVSGPAFTVTGSDLSTSGQAGKQDTGSPADAKICATPAGQSAYKTDEAAGDLLVREWQKVGLPTSAEFLADFLSGTGDAVDLPATSLAAAEIKRSPVFTAENNNVLTYIQQQVADGAHQIKLPAPNPLDTFAFLSYASPDLYLAFGATNGLNVSGSASIVGSNYVGSLTYVISESYGFNTGDTLPGVGTAMRYLQTICGAPYYPGGAHWFPLTVTISEPFSLPR